MKNNIVHVIFLLLVLVGVIIGILYSGIVPEIVKEMYFKMQKYAAEGGNVQEFIYPILAIGTFSIILLAVLFFIFIPKQYIGWLVTFILLVIFSAAVLAALSEVYKDEITDYLKARFVSEQSATEETK